MCWLCSKDVIALFFVVLIFVANALFEFLFRLVTKNSNAFISFWEQQDRILNYYMGVVSIMAIYVALNPKNANEINLLIMIWAISVLVGLVMTNIYRKTFIDSGFVEKECVKIWR